MNGNNPSRDDAHAKAWDLLPWLANGTLDKWSKRLVEDHARECVACRKELDLLREIGETMWSRDEPRLSPERSLPALMDRIDRAEAVREASATRRLAGWLGRLDLSHRGVLAVQAVVLALLVGTVAWFWSTGQAPRFQTLSTTAEPLAFELPRVRVVFDDRLSIAEMREILDEIGAAVVDGPSAHGVYTVEIEPAGDGGSDVAMVIDNLKEREGVRFAEPLREGTTGQRP